ncbi:hypothetical protein RJV04_005069 [Salmonella enterica]|nr:hypothetical protein [Salmonella enterica]
MINKKLLASGICACLLVSAGSAMAALGSQATATSKFTLNNKLDISAASLGDRVLESVSAGTVLGGFHVAISDGTTTPAYKAMITPDAANANATDIYYVNTSGAKVNVDLTTLNGAWEHNNINGAQMLTSKAAVPAAGLDIVFKAKTGTTGVTPGVYSLPVTVTAVEK